MYLAQAPSEITTLVPTSIGAPASTSSPAPIWPWVLGLVVALLLLAWFTRHHRQAG